MIGAFGGQALGAFHPDNWTRRPPVRASSNAASLTCSSCCHHSWSGVGSTARTSSAHSTNPRRIPYHKHMRNEQTRSLKLVGPKSFPALGWGCSCRLVRGSVVVSGLLGRVRDLDLGSRHHPGAAPATRSPTPPPGDPRNRLLAGHRHRRALVSPPRLRRSPHPRGHPARGDTTPDHWGHPQPVRPVDTTSADPRRNLHKHPNHTQERTALRHGPMRMAPQRHRRAAR